MSPGYIVEGKEKRGVCPRKKGVIMKARFDYRCGLALGSQALAVAGLLTSCSTTPVQVQAVGPKPPVIHYAGGTGSLVVYSDTEARHLDKGLPYYVHTSYFIKTQAGVPLRWVPNHLGDMDQTPQVVSLPAGTYQIVADSSDYGRVDVPVVIESGRTTEVHLDGTGYRKPGVSEANGRDWVCLPDGEPVGWRAYAGNQANPGQ